jgi:hypothetical protein
MKTPVAVAILAMVIVPPALAKAKRAKSAPQQGYQSSERPGFTTATLCRIGTATRYRATDLRSRRLVSGVGSVKFAPLYPNRRCRSQYPL